jgi:hypothetical protein
MNPTPAGLALLAAAAVAAVPAPAAPPPAAPDPSPFAQTALGAVLAANRGTVPTTGEDLTAALQKLGGFAQLPVAFSAVAATSGLAHPRVVLAPRPALPLGTALPNEPGVSGRLFLAANMTPGGRAGPRVASVEFIAWNAHRRAFDFGVIEGLGGPAPTPRVRVVENGRCFACHKNRGPILGAGPWSNTVQSKPARTAAAELFRLGPGAGPAPRFDGMAVLTPEAAAVNAGVRFGEELLYRREVYRLLAGLPEGRRALLLILGGVVDPAPVADADRKIRTELDALLEPWFKSFEADRRALDRSMPGGTLIDFSPVPTPRPGNWACVSPAQVAKYDAARAKGQSALPSAFQPSNPRAFTRPPAPAVHRFSEVIGALSLARTVGLTTGDRALLTRVLTDAAKRAKVTPAVLAREVFEGDRFTELLTAGELPDRDDFKDRFVDELADALVTRHGVTGGAGVTRREYASAPRRDTANARPVPEPAAPTSACLRCHDVRGPADRPSDLIPPLAFDPFDRSARSAWVGASPAADRKAVLARLLKRLAEDRDMPPEDAPEHRLFRVKDPAAFDDARLFLEAELDRVR